MEVVLSGENRYDDYGNFWFKDKEGKERKIGTKREDFEELCARVENNPNRAVSLNFDHYMNKPYIVGVELLDKQIQVDEAKITEQQVVIPKTQEFSPQETGMWWKEVGENIRAGITKYDTSIGKAEILAYKARMHLVLGIKELKKED